MIFKHTSLYRYLLICEQVNLDKKILDLGAGGDTPSLSLFKENGYDTFGVEIDEEQLELAEDFAYSRNEELNISLGDMRNIVYDDESFNFVYSYNSIFHMDKKDIEKTLFEMKRVLKNKGVMFVNFLNIEEGYDKYFLDMQILYKEIRLTKRKQNGKWIEQGFVDYILRKI